MCNEILALLDFYFYKEFKEQRLRMLFTTHYSVAEKFDMLFRQPMLTFVYFKGQTIWESPFKDQ